MAILPMIVKSKSEFEEYGLFFIDYDGRDDKTTFAIKVEDLDLPDYSSKTENLRKLKHPNCGNGSDKLKAVKAQILEEDDADKKEKSTMVHHFVIDFSSTILQFKIRRQMEDSHIKGLVEMTMYDLQYYIYRIVRKYGHQIE